MFHSCSLYVPFTSLQIPLLFPSCSPHAPQCSTMSPTCPCHIPAMSRHVPAMSPDRFGDTVRIIDNVLVKHKRRAAIYIFYIIYLYVSIWKTLEEIGRSVCDAGMRPGLRVCAAGLLAAPRPPEGPRFSRVRLAQTTAKPTNLGYFVARY